MNVIFYHMFCRNDYIKRFNKTYNKIVESGLIDNIDAINVVYVGGECDSEIKKPNVNIIKGETPNAKGEMDTLRHLWDFCQDNECNVLYLHSKGTSKPHNQNVNDWVDLMEYFLIERYSECLEHLKEHDSCGVNLKFFPMPHYAGNFWWATSTFIKSRDRFDHLKNSRFEPNTGRSVERYYCELWLLDTPNKKPKELFNSKRFPHYKERYPREKYEIN